MYRDDLCEGFFFPDRRGTQNFPWRLNRMTYEAYQPGRSDSNADVKPRRRSNWSRICELG